MSDTKVIIVGCGIAGPVLATFLKLKGYSPVIYERLSSDPEGGVGLM
jgi:salicylate hydroxylase